MRNQLTHLFRHDKVSLRCKIKGCIYELVERVRPLFWFFFLYLARALFHGPTRMPAVDRIFNPCFFEICASNDIASLWLFYLWLIYLRTVSKINYVHVIFYQKRLNDLFGRSRCPLSTKMKRWRDVFLCTDITSLFWFLHST